MAYGRIRAFRWAALLAGAAVAFCGAVLRAQDSSLTPRGMDALAAHATFSTDFTFNKTMLDAASQTMPDDLRPLVARLRSITVQTFRFSAPGMYAATDLDAIRAQYTGHGWTHWTTREHTRGARTSSPAHSSNDPNVGTPDPDFGDPATASVRAADPLRTDVWVQMDHTDFDRIVLLVANERNVNLVVVDGTIDPLEILHLRGHFGIPRDAGRDWE